MPSRRLRAAEYVIFSELVWAGIHIYTYTHTSTSTSTYTSSVSSSGQVYTYTHIHIYTYIYMYIYIYILSELVWAGRAVMHRASAVEWAWLAPHLPKLQLVDEKRLLGEG